MSKKILVADDSLTIQKVIGITLSGHPYVLDEAKNEQELLAKIQSEKYDLILLDYNLSENTNGSDLISAVREKTNTVIMVMLGTFDSVDENLLRELGVNETITKPFESDNFISKCQNILSEQGQNISMDIEQEDASIDIKSQEQELSAEEAMDDSWVISSPGFNENSGIHELDLGQLDEEITISSAPSDNALDKELAGWGVEIPSKIGEKPGQAAVQNLPPILGKEFVLNKSNTENEDMSVRTSDPDSTDSFNIQEYFKKENSLKAVDDSNQSEDEDEDDSRLPDESELEYPDLEQINLQGDIEYSDDIMSGLDEEIEEETITLGSASSKLIPLDELAQEEDEDSTDPSFELPRGLSEELKLSIKDEVSPDDFWAVDEGHASLLNETTAPIVISSENSGVEYDQSWDIESNMPAKEASDFEAKSATSINEDQIVDKIISTLRPSLEGMIQNIVKETLESALKNQCGDSVDRIAWEVIPDLAENLIRDELKKITDSLDI